MGAVRIGIVDNHAGTFAAGESSHNHLLFTGSRVMPSLSIAVPHSLTTEEATERLKSLFSKIKERHGDKVSNLEESWDGNRLAYAFSTFGFNIKGDLNVEPNEVQINGTIPFAAMMFKGKIEQSVREELEKTLA